MSKPSFSPTSRLDLHAIFDYIAQNSPQAAVDVVRKIEEKCNLLAEAPDMGFVRDDLLLELRASPVGRYVIIYRILNGGIDIVRIVHGARDFGALFE